MSRYGTMDPTIRFTLTMRDSCPHYVLEVSTYRGEARPFTGLVSKEELASLRVGLGRDIDDFKAKVGAGLDLTKTLTRVDAAMYLLHKRATTFLGTFLGAARGDSWKLRDLCNDALDYWPKDRPPVIEFRGERESMFPIEFLPLFGDGGSYTPITSLEDLRREANRYVGFRAVVYRTMVSDGRQESYIRQRSHKSLVLDGHRLPVKLFYHARLRGAIMEANFLTLLNDASMVELEGPWPEDTNGRRLSDNTAIRLLNKHLTNPQLPLHGHDPRCVGDQVQHFACHCESAPPEGHHPTREEEHDFPCIRLATQTQVVKIPYEALQLAFMEGGPPRATELPLLFMNACDTSRIEPDTATTFVKYFLDQGNRGFIGTVSGIPDPLAAEFSRLFYKELIRGHNVGTSVWSVRNRVLRRRANPLGLLYTFFGDPHISTHEATQEVEEHVA